MKRAVDRMETTDLRSLSEPELRAVLEEAIALDLRVELLIQPMMVMKSGLRRTYGRQLETRDLTAPTWLEDPSPVMRMVREGVEEDRLEEQAGERERAVAAVRQRLEDFPPPVRQRYEELLRVAQEASVVLKEEKFWLHGRCRAPLRAVLMEFARRLTAEARLEQLDDIWWLTPEELLGKAAGMTPPPELGMQP